MGHGFNPYNLCITMLSTVLFGARQNKKKTKIGNLYNQVPYLTQDTILESDKNTRKHLIQESQEVSPFLAGDHKAAWHKQYTMAKTDPK